MRFLVIKRSFSIISFTKTSNKLDLSSNKLGNSYFNKVYDKYLAFSSYYETLIGTNEIKQAQEEVKLAEKNFVDAQARRIELTLEINELQKKLRRIGDEMSRLNRSDDKFDLLYKEERKLLQIENQLLNENKLQEAREREHFFNLSSAVTSSQNKERTRAENFKYVQLTFSLTGTILGIVGTLIYSYYRNAPINRVMEFEKEFQATRHLIDEMNVRQVQIEKQTTDILSKQDHLLASSSSSQVNPISSEINEPNDLKHLVDVEIYKRQLIVPTVLYSSACFGVGLLVFQLVSKYFGGN